MRPVVVSIALLLIGVCGAKAQSYRVAYAVKVRAGEASGTAACRNNRRCVVDLKSLRMRLAISMPGRYPDRADVVLDGEDGCCLFEGATRRPSVNPGQPPLHLRLFIGEASRGLEYVENEPVGALDLKFDLEAGRVSPGDSDRPGSSFSQRAPI
jgi:hypothetical protein